MRVVVGRVGRAQGLRGEVTVEVRTDAPEERFRTGAVVFVSRAAGSADADEATVAAHRWQNGRLVLRLAGVSDRTGAESLRGAILESEVDVTDTTGDEYHDLALVGLEVRDPQGRALGRVVEVLHLPGQDLLAVHRGAADELLVPFVRAIVTRVDVPAGLVVVDLPDGLAELGADPPAGLAERDADPPAGPGDPGRPGEGVGRGRP